MEALAGVPWYGLCFAAFAFLVTITGVIIEAIWLDYQVGYRQWRQLPADGSIDDQSAQLRMQTIQEWKARPSLVDYRANL